MNEQLARHPAFLEYLTAPHPALGTGEEAGLALKLAVLSGFCSIISILSVGLMLIVNGRVTIIGVAISALFVLTYALSRSRRADIGVWLTTVGLIVLITGALITTSNSDNIGQILPLLLVPLVLSSLLHSARTMVILALVMILGLTLLMTFSIWEQVQQDIAAYAVIALVGALLTAATMLREHYMLETQSTQAAILPEPTPTSVRQNAQAIIVAGRIAASAHQASHLMTRIPGLIARHFGATSVQVYLAESTGQALVLAAGVTNGRQIAAGRPRRMAVSASSTTARVMASGETAVLTDDDADWDGNIPAEGHTGLMLPLLVGWHAIGAISVYRDDPEGFSAAEISALESVVGLLAVAIENLRQTEKVQDELRDVRRLKGKLAAAGWHDYSTLRSSQPLGYRAGADGVTAINNGEAPPHPVAGTLELPVRVHGEVIAVLGVTPRDGADAPDEETRQLLQAASARIASALESSRLYHEAQRAARRESKAGAIAERLQRAPNLDLLLEDAARELAAALDTEDVYAEIGTQMPLPRAGAGRGNGNAGEAAP